MLRALLVDDEPIALEGLKLLINWEAEGFEICGECASGDEALTLLPTVKPDLIVTDIRMPGMSGLELLKASRELGFDGQFIIVSGYSDFSYAKNALQLGVAGYLLKPVEPTEAADVLTHVRRKLIDRETQSSLQAQTAYHAITALLTDPDAPADGIAQASGWVLATWGAPLPYSVVQALLGLFAQGEATAHIVEDKEYLALRLRADRQLPDLSGVQALLGRYKRRLNISEPVTSPAALFVQRVRLSDRLDHVCHHELTEHVDALARMVLLRQADECVARCRDLETFCAGCGTGAAIQARRQLLSVCTDRLSDRPEALQTFLRAQNADFQTLCLLAIQLLAPEQERVSDAMEHYAREHMSEHITVNGIAAALGYNATYLGRKFCEERGVGFREWLTGQRVSKGAELLRSTDLSVNAIARTVGYGEYKRFLKHFKQRFCIAPEQYRRTKP